MSKNPIIQSEVEKFEKLWPKHFEQECRKFSLNILHTCLESLALSIYGRMLEELPLFRGGKLDKGETEEYRDGRNIVLREIRQLLEEERKKITS